MPSWLKAMGLNAYEYSCSKVVNIGEQTAKEIGRQAESNDIFLSIHAPYYINMASTEQDKKENSKKYVLDTLRAASWMGAKRIVVHIGSCSKMCREKALATSMKVLSETIEEADAAGFGDITICPEVLGKINQLGSLDEILELCSLDERLIPTVDFGHVNALTQGGLVTKKDYRAILGKIRNSLGEYRLRNMHCHFSRIEYTAAGEKKHWTLADRQYGPEFEPLAELIAEYGLEPVIICESRGTMAEDALELKGIYLDKM
jgi:deoxyribonuclease-4